jgi:hypothetical protein
MPEAGGRHNSEEARLDEFGRLSDAMDEEETKIEEGTDTSAEQLDRYLTAAATFHHWHALNPRPEMPGERESEGVWFVKYQRILNGTYQVEKANYALETAQYRKKEADEREIGILDPEEDEREKEKYRLWNAEDRTIAANWYRVTANCLEMPTARPAPTQENRQK